MAVPFVFTHRHLGYQIGCGVLLLATVLGLFGVVSPGWYRVENSKTGKQFYSHLWIVCSDGMSSCGLLRAEKTKDFEKATQAFSVLGVLSLVTACLLAVFLNFFSQNKGHNRWLEIAIFVAGGVTFLAAVIFVAGNPDYLSMVDHSHTGYKVSNGYGVALTFLAAILAVIAAVVVLIFNKKVEVPQDQRSLSALRHRDPVEHMHHEIEDSEAGFGDPHRQPASPSDPPPHYSNFERPTRTDLVRSPQPRLSSENGVGLSLSQPQDYGNHLHLHGRSHGRPQPRSASPNQSETRDGSYQPRSEREADLRIPRSRSYEDHGDDVRYGDLGEPTPSFYSARTPRQSGFTRPDIVHEGEIRMRLGVEPDDSSPPHYSSHYLYSQDTEPRQMGPRYEYNESERRDRPVSLHSYDHDRYGRQLSHEGAYPSRQTAHDDKKPRDRSDQGRHSLPDVTRDTDPYDPKHDRRDIPQENRDCDVGDRPENPYQNVQGAQRHRLHSGNDTPRREQRHSRDVTEADIDVPSGLPPPLYTIV